MRACRRRRRDDRRGRADRPRARLLPGLDDPRAAQDRRRARRGHRRRRRDRREERAGQRRRRRRSTRNSTPASTLLEGLLVKKAGLSDAVGLIDGLYPGAAGGRACATSPRAPRSTPPRIGEVYTKGTLTLARLGREAPIAAASPAGAVLRNVEGGSLAARLLYPNVRHEAPGEAAALAGHRRRRPRPVRAARRHRGAAQAAARPPDREEPVADPRAIRVRARDQRRRRDRRARAARPRGARSSPAATACCR